MIKMMEEEIKDLYVEIYYKEMAEALVQVEIMERDFDSKSNDQKFTDIKKMSNLLSKAYDNLTKKVKRYGYASASVFLLKNNYWVIEYS